MKSRLATENLATAVWLGKSRQVKSGLATENLATDAWLGKSRQVKSGLATENLGTETWLGKSGQVKSRLATENLGTEAWLGKSRQVKSGLAKSKHPGVRPMRQKHASPNARQVRRPKILATQTNSVRKQKEPPQQLLFVEKEKCKFWKKYN